MGAKNRRQKRKCMLKKTYGTQRAAERDAAWLLRTKGWHNHPYRCRFCGKFHLSERDMWNDKRLIGGWDHGY